MNVLQMSFLAPPVEELTWDVIVAQIGPVILAFGWLTTLFLILWIAWSAYRLLKMIDYVSGIQWTFLQVTIPPDAEETPKSMEILYDVLGSIHKSPDLVEQYFDGYLEAWYSCEIQCTQGVARYILVIPAAHRQTFEGVIYGQYPRAEVKEVEDYTLRYKYSDLREKFDMFGTEIVLANEDVFPIKTYRSYEDSLSEGDTYVDPHQSLIEAFTSLNPGEEMWVQFLIRPLDAKRLEKYNKDGEKKVAEISGQAKEDELPVISRVAGFFLDLPGQLLTAAISGTTASSEKEEAPKLFRLFNPVDEAKMKGILQKISQNNFKLKIRVIYIAPPGQLQKPSIGRTIGAFKQFNTLHMNSVKPDNATKTNGPNYVMREVRRKLRERSILLHYQWRDMWGIEAGYWMSAEELATLYHFPAKHVRSPSVQRAKAGQRTPPQNLPYA